VCVANEAGTAKVTATDTASQISGSTKITVRLQERLRPCARLRSVP
jgi:hypothetical protein